MRPSEDLGRRLPQPPELWSGESAVRTLMRACNWQKTPLGPPEAWPQSLRATVRIMLTSRFAMWMAWGPELTFLCNDAYLPTVGIKRDWVIGSRSDKVWAEIWPDIGPRIQRVLETGEATWDEALLLYLQRSGFTEETYHTFSYSPLADDEGRTSGMLCVVAEVTEKVIGERQLATLRDLGARLAAASTRDQVMAGLRSCLAPECRDLPFALAYLAKSEEKSATLAAVHGLPMNSLAAQSRIDFEGTAAVWDLARAATGAAVLVDLPSEAVAGLSLEHWQTPPAQALIAPMRSKEGGAPVGYLVAGLNPHRSLDAGYRGFIELLTAQVAAAIARADEYEHERERAQALAEVDRAKTAFFSNVSHEFRTPLTLMLGPLEDALATANGVSAPLREQLNVAHRNALRLLRLVNTLLDFSRIESGRTHINYRPTDLSALTADLASSFRSATDRAGLKLVVDTPALSRPVYVDRSMWEKIVLNLVSNAFKFTFEGEIAVELREDRDLVRLTVRDSGTGIPDHELPKLFDRFHRVEGAQGRSFEGSGIGLALVRELVRQHGGDIAVESQLGRGSAFTVTIPHGVAHLPAERIQPEGAENATRASVFVDEALRWLPNDEMHEALLNTDSAPAATPDASAKRSVDCRVILADDNADLREYMARLLTEQGYAVQTVADGESALDALRASRPDLLISDVMMPRLDGFGLLRQVRDDPSLRDLPVIMLSARAGEEARVEGLDAGADDYLTKPFSARELLARVSANFKLSRIRQEAAEALRASEQRLRDLNATLERRVAEALAEKRLFANLVEATDASVQVVDFDFRFLAINAAAKRDFLRVFGASPRVGDSILEVLADLPEQREGARKAWARVLAGEAFVETAWWGDAPHERRAYETRFSPLFDADGRQIGAYVLGQDVTERLREQERLKEAEEQLRQAQKMEAIGQLTGGVAHDFNNLLTPIVGALDLLERRGLGGERERRLINGATQSAERAKTLVQRLLAFSRRQPLQTVAVDIVALVSGMADLIASTTGPQIRVSVDLADHLPSAKADPNQLEMALLNLAVNARDAMPDGGALRISAREGRVPPDDTRLPIGRYLRLSVSDTGVGMDEATLARAAEPFFSTKGVGKGTGLGLSMVHGLAAQLGGALTIQSRRGAGTNIDLWLPVSGEPASIASARPSATKAPTDAGATVLLIDDEELARATTAYMLSDLGYKVVEASSGEEGLRLLRSGVQPDILVTDHLMPGMNGTDIARIVRSERPGVRVLLISGYADVDGVAPDLPRLVKPFRNDELAASLARLRPPTAQNQTVGG